MSTDTDLQSALSQWCIAHYGESSVVANLRRLTGGASQETWSFDVTDAAETQIPLILRRAPFKSEVSESSSIGLQVEARLLRSAHDAGVPTPNVIDVFEETHPIGDAFIMNRIDGETLGQRILKDPSLENARQKLGRQCGGALGQIHSIEIESLPELPVSSSLDQLAKYEAVYRSFEVNRSVFELAMQWLKNNAPEATPNTLVHGDFRLGNFIIDESGLAAVLDWELAHLGDPREDIAWICVNSWRFGRSENRVGGFSDLDTFLSAYNDASGAAFTPEEVFWWELLGSFKWGVMCLMMYQSYKTGDVPTVERAAIGRRTSETEIDMINLLETQRHA